MGNIHQVNKTNSAQNILDKQMLGLTTCGVH